MSATPPAASEAEAGGALSPTSSDGERSRSRPPKRALSPSLFWAIREDIPRRLSLALMALSLLVPFGVWWIAASSGKVPPLFLPSPGQVAGAVVRLAVDGSLITDVWFSIFRVFGGFVLAAVLSIPLGILMGSFASIRALGEPLTGTLRYMPAPAFIPLLILYLGLDEAPKIVLIFIGTFFFNTLMVMDAVKCVPKELIETTYTLGGARRQTVLQVICPYILPNILDACRVNLAASWNLVIVSELIAATEGIGRRISLAQRFMKTDEIFAGLLVIGVIGLAIDLFFRVLFKLTCKWAE
jgi:NitT/TauT family transport system permease protein